MTPFIGNVRIDKSTENKASRWLPENGEVNLGGRGFFGVTEIF